MMISKIERDSVCMCMYWNHPTTSC